MLDILRQDTGYAVRGLRRSPLLTATAVLTLALGLGANGAIFSIVDPVFFRAPEAVVDPGQVRRILTFEGTHHFPQRYTDQLSAPDLADFQRIAGRDAQIEAYMTDDRRLFGDTAQRVIVGMVSTGFFHLLGVHPEAGRFFSPDETRLGDPRAVVVLSDALWRARFGADPTILGKTVRFDTHDDSTAYVVVGISQAGFTGIDVDAVDAWVPLAARDVGFPRGAAREGPTSWYACRFCYFGMVGIARIAKGSSEAALSAHLTVAFRQPQLDQNWADPRAVVSTAPLIEARGPTIGSDPDARNRSLALRLAGVALIVLLIAIANVASLLLMRGFRRRREIAVRVALGVSRRRLVAQLCIESVLLAAIAALAALLVADWCGGVLRATLLGDIHWAPLIVNTRLAAFVGLLALAAGMFAGLVPAVLVTLGDLTTALKAGAPESGHQGSLMRVGLLAGQAALCVVLLAGAGVFVQSFRRALAVDLGYDAQRLVEVYYPGGAPDRTAAQYAEAITRLRALPQVEAVGRATNVALGGIETELRLSSGETIPPDGGPEFTLVDTGFFGVAGYRVVSGRPLLATDVAGAPLVAVVDQEMARRYWPGTSPVGDCFSLGTSPCRRIVGVIEDIRGHVDERPSPGFVLPAAQAQFQMGLIDIVVRMRSVPRADVVRTMRDVTTPFLSVGSRPPIVYALNDRIEKETRPWRIGATVFLLFGVLGLLSAAAGIFGLVAYDATRRTREIGVRIALGARARDILALMLSAAGRVVLIGVMAGIGAALLSGRVLSSLLFNTSPFDPVVLGATAAILIAAAGVAAIVPAWRATRVDPVVALRAE